MTSKLRITTVILACLTITGNSAMAELPTPPVFKKFTRQMVAGKTMVSSGYPNGSMTFNTNGSLTCINYPAFVSCKSWQIQPDGTLLRHFTDSHTGTTVEVQAIWKLMNTSGSSMEVQQSSTNSKDSSRITVTVR